MSSAISIPDPNDNWAQVELFRWQYGELPQPTDTRPLDVAEGLRKMSVALMEGCQKDAATEAKENMPSPFNVVSVMQYVAKLLYFAPPAKGDSQSRAVIRAMAGRNWPCPCGSGKKFKKCCLSKGGAQ